MKFVGLAKRLDNIDLPRLGAQMGVGEDPIHAVMDVESTGSGFDRQGRPKALFEPHLFYRFVPAKLREEAVRSGLAYPRWGQRPYPADSYFRISEAMALNEEAALRATSWGMFQILGSNCQDVGYPTARDMVEAFLDDEEHHLDACVKFCIANHIDDDLQRLDAIAKSGRKTTPDDCRVIARVYNGPKYERHGYHIRLANRHNWWRKIPDTPWAEPELPAGLHDAKS